MGKVGETQGLLPWGIQIGPIASCQTDFVAKKIHILTDGDEGRRKSCSGLDNHRNDHDILRNVTLFSLNLLIQNQPNPTFRHKKLGCFHLTSLVRSPQTNLG